jgi:hypothetical protein
VAAALVPRLIKQEVRHLPAQEISFGFEPLLEDAWRRERLQSWQTPHQER